MNSQSYKEKFSMNRTPVYTNKGLVATCQPLAAEAGAEILRKGGNAVDAAVATAAALTVVEPTSNGIGGDAFAIVWMKDKLYGLNSSGPSPAGISIEKLKAAGLSEIPKYGMIPITVPGVPKAWSSLVERFGNLSLAEVLEPAVRLANEGFPVSQMVAYFWKRAHTAYGNVQSDEFAEWFNTFSFDGKPPEAGQLITMKNHGRAIQAIGETNGEAFYKGELAEAIDATCRKYGGYLRKEDLERYEATWVDPVSVDYKGYDVCELPPNGQGIIALMGLNTMKHLEISDFASVDTVHKQFEAMKMAFTDGLHYISDPHAMAVGTEAFLADAYGKTRATQIGDTALEPLVGEPKRSGTVYLATADADGNMVSYIQSNYMGFGSGVVIPGYGIGMQNRGHTFSLDENHVNALKPGKRTYHTIIPGFLMKDGQPLGPFGVMGGFMQPQGHMQVIMNMIDYGMNPQDALDAPRWQWTEGKKFTVEEGLGSETIEGLIEKGHEVEVMPNGDSFGRGQIILKKDNGVYVAGTETRADGYIAIQ